jgi:hypothetical protein
MAAIQPGDTQSTGSASESSPVCSSGTADASAELN